jgi:hypothetical protein
MILHNIVLAVALVGLVVSQPPPGVYIWGPHGEPIPKNVDRIGLDSDPDLSVVRLLHVRDKLVIDLVKRGADWPEDESFCSLMLPAAIRDFIQQRELDISTDIKAFWVVNVSEPPEAGCKCYTRTMLGFGFDSVNRIPSDRFCSHPDYDGIMTAVPSGKHEVRLGVSSSKQIAYMKNALHRR